ncbi:MAG TPA: hypothetical protein VFG15_21710 [Amycolatopsis sp.]|nr:hypothetical protein [Amycolatopsis sp.]
MREAVGGFEESASQLGQAVYGTADPALGALPGQYGALSGSAEQAVGQFRAVKAKISAYLDSIGVSVTPANTKVEGPKRENEARGRPGVHTTTSESDPPKDERADELRSDLPPPAQKEAHTRKHTGDGLHQTAT